MEPLDVDTRRHDRDRQRPPGGALGLARCVLSGRHDVAGASEHGGERLLRARQATRHRDLGAVQHDVVRQLQRRPDESERHRRVEHDEVGADVGGQRVDPRHHRWVREQHRLTHPLHPERLGGVELGRPGVRAGEHGERVRRQAPPPLPQQRLDAADLRREVVRDEEVLHDAGDSGAGDVPRANGAAIASRPSRSLAQRACSASISSAPSRYRARTDRVRESEPSPVLPSTTSALRRSHRGSRPAMYHRP